jgi:serine/threonine-protein kinase
VASVKQLLARRADDPKLAPVLKTIACPLRQGADGAVELLVGDRVMEPSQIAALILGHIKDHAEEQLGRPIEKAVLAYPPSFDARQVAELQKAAKLAELQVAALVTEPMAVALAHHPGPDRHSVLGVADLGGGAVSFSIVNVAGTIHQLAGSASDPSLGGDQLSLALAAVAVEDFRRTAGVDARRNAHDWHRIVLECEKAKWLLSQETEVIVSLPLSGEDSTLFVATLQPTQFHQLAKGWIDRAMAVCLRGLHEASVGRRDLKEVVVTGGMARLPGLANALRELFVFDPLRVATPELSVAIGAAVQGAKLEGLKVQPVRQTLDGRQPMSSWLITPGSQDVQPEPAVGDLDLQVESGLDVDIEPAAGVEDEAVDLEPFASAGVGLQLSEAAVAAERPKNRVGSFDLLAEIGQDEVGTTFLSRVAGPEGVQQPVTVRIIHEHLARDRAFLTGYLDAVANASRLRHPAITQIFEHGEHGATVYLAMECLAGAPLLEVRNRLLDPATGRMDPRVACYIAIQVAEGLHYAHETTDLDGRPLEIVHRDVSPPNIVVTYGGDVKLVDFGLPKPSALSRETPTANMRSLFAYQSPEIIKDALVDRRSDVFALGINLWELLAGQSLFERATVAETIGRVIAEPVPLVSELRPGIPPSLAAAIARALKRDRDERHQTAWDFHEAVVAAAAELGGPATPQVVGAMMEQAFAVERERWLTLTTVALGQRPSQPPIPRPTGVLPPVTAESQAPDEEVPTDVYSGGLQQLPQIAGLGAARTIPHQPLVGASPGNAEAAITNDWQPQGPGVLPSESAVVRATVPGPAGSATRRRLLVLAVVLVVLCVVSALAAYFMARWLGRDEAVDADAALIARTTPSKIPPPPDAGAARIPDGDVVAKLPPIGPTVVADAGQAAGDAATPTADAAPAALDATPAKTDAEAAPTAATVTVTLKLRPPDASVFVDGVQQTDTKVLELTKSRTPVKIKAEAPGYYTKVVLVIPNQNRRQVISLLRKTHRVRRRPPTTTRKTTTPTTKTTKSTKTTKRTMWR